MGCGWTRWLRRCQSGLYTADKSGSSPGENFHNKGRGTELSAVAFKALLRSEREVRSGSGSGFYSLSRLLWTVKNALY